MRCIFTLLALALVFNVLAQKNKSTGGFYEYEVVCMGNGIDGTQLVKAFGKGKKTADAIEQAKKNAVHAIIFKGVQTGESGCKSTGIVLKPGTFELHRDYFETFFKEGGKYLQFVSLSNDGSIDPKDKYKVGKMYKVGVTVSVMHSSLRKELESAKIVEKFGSGF